jgi:hypothetical protein
MANNFPTETKEFTNKIIFPLKYKGTISLSGSGDSDSEGIYSI